MEFYEDLAETVGVAIDLGSEAWANKTVAAYTAYISSYMAVNDAQSFYQSGAAIEQLTGYDVVSVRDGRYYMNSCDDGAGGAMYDIDCGDPSNMAALSKETMKWIRYAANNGPDWPNGSSGGGSSGGVTPTDGVYLVNADLASMTPATTNPGTVSYVYVGATYDSTTNTSSGGTGTKYYPNRLQTKYTPVWPTTIQFRLSAGLVESIQETGYDLLVVSTPKAGKYVSDIALIKVPSGTYTVSASTTEYGYITFYQSWVMYYNNALTNSMTGDTLYLCFNDGTLKTKNAGTYAINGDMSNSRAAIGYLGYITGGGSGGGGAIEGDDTVPNPPTIPHPDISWPDISLPSLPDFNPTINITTEGTYNPTTGEIDFTPITDRLDAIDENLEYFYDSFNSFFSDFLSYMDALGDGVGGIQEQLYNVNVKLREVITWLRNIFYNMGNGGSSQPDPTTNDEGWWDWLGKLIDALVGDLPSGIGSFTSALSQLTGRFPFSVPWDMAFMLGLLSHEPVTPVVTLYLPTFNAAGYVGLSTPLVVDLTGWSLVAEVVRRSEFLLFALSLATWTIDGIKGIDWTLFE